MNTRKLIWVLPLAGLLLTACSSEKGKKEHGGQAQYKTLIVQRSDQTLTSEYTARLTGRQIVEIRPQVSGNITRICINEGQQVTKGQTLFIIDQVSTSENACKKVLDKLDGNYNLTKIDTLGVLQNLD